MTIRIPPKADIETQNAFRDIEQRLRDLESARPTAQVPQTDIETIKADIEKMKADPDKYEELRETTFVAPVNFEGDLGVLGNIYPGFLDVSTVGSADQKTMNMHGSLAIAPGGLSADSVFCRTAIMSGREVLTPHGFVELTRTTAQEIANDSITAVQWEVISNPDNLFSTASTTRITVNKTGWWLFTASVQWESNTTGKRFLAVRVDGTTLRANSDHGAVTNTSANCVSDLISLTSGQYVEAVVYQNSTVAIDVNANRCFFSAKFLGNAT